VHHHLIGLLDRLQRSSRMTGLAAPPTSALLSQRLGGRFGQSIGAGRFAAIAAGQGQPILQFSDLAAQRTHFGFQTQQQLNHRPQARAGQLPQLPAPLHARKAERKSLVSG
jgi:hypothetical protein